jgi:hypothetical protein
MTAQTPDSVLLKALVREIAKIIGGPDAELVARELLFEAEQAAAVRPDVT